jgi:cell fate (sporulation/competence/biofilm development) regulator YlbF (YheA/YmcA/DUF963 family)
MFYRRNLMPADTQQILKAAEDLGKLVSQHPAVERYRDSQKAIANDPEAGRLLNEFNRQILTLARQEEGGMPATDAQRRQLESLQTQLASHIKIKALNLAQVEFVDLMRKISDGIRRYVSETPEQGEPPQPPAGGQGTGPRLVI